LEGCLLSINCTELSRKIVKRIGVRGIRRFLFPICALLLIALLTSGILTAGAVPAAEKKGDQSDSLENQHKESPKTKTDSFKFSVDVNLVTTDVTVIGKPLSELRAEDFHIYDNKVFQEVTFFSFDQLPIAVAILIDQSGSVAPYFPLLQISSILALKNLKPEDQVALFAFSTNCDQVVELTTDRLLIANKISKLNIEGGTEIFNALYKTARYLLKNAPDRRRAIIMVSDNCDYGSNPNMKRALN